MKENINTNLDDYTIEELSNLLELKKNYTKEEVIEKTNFFNEHYFINNEKMKINF